MNENQLASQYSTGLSQRNIERALIAAGKDLEHLVPADLGLLEDFHTMGRYATAQLVDLAGITSGSAVLDAGSGVGGTARYVADQLRLQGYRGGSDRRILRNQPLAQSTRRAGRPDMRFVRATSPGFPSPMAASTSRSASMFR